MSSVLVGGVVSGGLQASSDLQLSFPYGVGNQYLSERVDPPRRDAMGWGDSIEVDQGGEGIFQIFSLLITEAESPALRLPSARFGRT